MQPDWRLNWRMVLVMLLFFVVWTGLVWFISDQISKMGEDGKGIVEAVKEVEGG